MKAMTKEERKEKEEEKEGNSSILEDTDVLGDLLLNVLHGLPQLKRVVYQTELSPQALELFDDTSKHQMNYLIFSFWLLRSITFNA